ncbi:DUF599 domain-containing protein [Marinomonas mediterranea]|jgi:Predicted membrane protein|uniref:DUF599 domain-containing protein n=1 Tax=Marinomonas mediterranea (strain ATCC 700492 / JCM 21426 / NBRC 103028 / MMB-1) TaxID=717774 RepID=F2K2P3_MARM1|nr:DUF599 domain-containing protein [Marinomonas mediterranea]ADZ91176.1 protein of unknown function DUF599 [Marinomonas mediterranea MMB-1]WCN09153.1 DUF599 family protein [Marinomonas mediterranea]WCN13229.1 DUF599 family protein [Marinomonas mediterranea]WCN17305.1 DUF599 family protein [Marinomonas mediterranea MMB-1]
METETASRLLDPLNIATIIVFFTCWWGYSFYAQYNSKRKSCLVSVLHQFRLAWMTRLLRRDNRIADASVMANLERSSLFFASSSLLIIAGLFTAFNYSEKAVGIIADFYLLAPNSQQEWEMKVIMLIVIFVYAFFTFTWSVRQYNFCSVLVGSAPLATERGIDESERQSYATHMARVCSLAANQFNYGLRAYYFAMAFCGWFLGPYFCMASSVMVVLVLYRREFRSKTFKTLNRGLVINNHAS